MAQQNTTEAKDQALLEKLIPSVPGENQGDNKVPNNWYEGPQGDLKRAQEEEEIRTQMESFAAEIVENQ